MKILIVVSNPNTKMALIGLSESCLRKQQDYLCFFTGDGVKLLTDEEIIITLKGATRCVVCEYSWDKHFTGQTISIEKGSQTDHSLMIAEVDRVISL